MTTDYDVSETKLAEAAFFITCVNSGHFFLVVLHCVHRTAQSGLSELPPAVSQNYNLAWVSEWKI